MALNFQVDEATAAQRRFPVYLVDATDGITAETGEGGGQPQISKNGAAFGNTSATLTAIGNGSYYVELTAGELDTLGMVTIRFKSAATAEFSLTGQVVSYDPYSATNLGLTNLDTTISSRSDFDETADPVELLDSGGAAGTSAAELVDDLWDEDIVATHGGADSGGLLLRALGAVISQRGNNPTLNALLGVPDAAGDDLSETVWAEGTRDLTALGFQLANGDFAAGAIDANAIAAGAITSSEAPNLDAAITTRATPAQVATALTDIRLDELINATAGGVDPTIASFLDLIMNADGGQTFSQATDSLEALAGASAPSAAVIADAVWDEDIVAAHGGADAAGLLLRALGALISQRANNATLNALLGVPDAAGDDISETIWSEGTRDLTALGFQLAAGDFAAGAIDANAIAAGAITASEAPNLDAAISSRAVAGDAMALTAGAVDDIWDELQAGHVDAGSFGLFLDSIVSNIQADTDDIQTRLPAALVGGAMDSDVSNMQANVVDANALATDAGQEIADRLLARSLATGADGGRTVQDALRLLRNLRQIAAGVLTVMEEDDATPAWTAVVTTAAGNPVDSIDPA